MNIEAARNVEKNRWVKVVNTVLNVGKQDISLVDAEHRIRRWETVKHFTVRIS